MICPYCGRRNPTGATFCVRCRQRLPVEGRIPTGRRARFAEPAGGGGISALALGAALLAGFVFIGGAAAIYLSLPPSSATLPPIAQDTSSPTLPPFVQPTASPSPSPTPSPSPSFAPLSPLPTSSAPVDTATPDPGVTNPPRTPRPTPNATRTPRPTDNPTPKPTDTPGPTGPVAKFKCNQDGFSLTINCDASNSTGQIDLYSWSFGATGVTASNTFNNYGEKSVTLTVSGPGGTDELTKTVQVQPEPTPAPTDSPPPPPAP